MSTKVTMVCLTVYTVFVDDVIAFVDDDDHFDAIVVVQQCIAFANDEWSNKQLAEYSNASRMDTKNKNYFLIHHHHRIEIVNWNILRFVLLI